MADTQKGVKNRSYEYPNRNISSWRLFTFPGTFSPSKTNHPAADGQAIKEEAASAAAAHLPAHAPVDVTNGT
jgi:hypothetical protein